MFKPEMYEWCRALQTLLLDRYPKDKALVHLVGCIQLQKEVNEVLDCVPWKFERKMPEESREHLLEELTDVFNYWMRLCFIHNVTPEEFMKAWEIKAKIVTERLLPCQDSKVILEKFLSHE